MGARGNQMYLNRRQKLVVLRVRLQKELDHLDASIQDIEARGVASMTISTGDGQKSATNIDLDKLVARRESVASQLASVNRQLEGRPSLKIVHHMTVRS